MNQAILVIISIGADGLPLFVMRQASVLQPSLETCGRAKMAAPLQRRRHILQPILADRGLALALAQCLWTWRRPLRRRSHRLRRRSPHRRCHHRLGGSAFIGDVDVFPQFWQEFQEARQSPVYNTRPCLVTDDDNDETLVLTMI